MRLNGRHILVVDDAPDVLNVLVMLLRLEGAVVTGAANGREALTAFKSRRFDVVVTDLGLPDIAGDLLIRALIAAAPRRTVIVIVITGEDGPAVARARAAGADVVFTKPCAWSSVVTYLDRLSVLSAA